MADEMKLNPVRMEKVYKMIEKNLGINKEQWDLYRDNMASIESRGAGDYLAVGGAGDHYDGRYQLGELAKADAADKLYGENKRLEHGDKDSEARQKFRNDPTLQEEMFAAYTIKNHGYMLSEHPDIAYNSRQRYVDAPVFQKLQYLSYAHNQGHMAAKKYMDTGVVTRDAFGTKGTKYMMGLDNMRLKNGVQFDYGSIDFTDFNLKASGNTPLSKGKIKYGR